MIRSLIKLRRSPQTTLLTIATPTKPRSGYTKITGPRGAGLVLDCVNMQPPINLGAKLLGRNSIWAIVGLGDGHHGFHQWQHTLRNIDEYYVLGSRIKLMEVIKFLIVHNRSSASRIVVVRLASLRREEEMND